MHLFLKILVCKKLFTFHKVFSVFDFLPVCRGETRALIGGGGGGEVVNIHIFVFCPTNFF